MGAKKVLHIWPVSPAFGLRFLGHPRKNAQPAGKDAQLVGPWIGDICTLVQGGGYVRDVVLTFTETTLTMKSPVGPILRGKYYCDTSINPRRIDWYVQSVLVRGLYTFGPDPETLILAWNRASTGLRPPSLNDSESVFVGPSVEAHGLSVFGGLEKLIA